jgi:sporulation protein YlmC with PRC-barrel domain
LNRLLRALPFLGGLLVPAASAYDNPDMLASELIGMEVRNLAGEEAGELEDLAIDTATGRVAYALLALRGFAGLGEERVAVPLSSLTVGMYGEVLIGELRPAGEVAARSGGALKRASALLQEPPLVDLIVDMEAGRVTHAVLHHAIVQFLDLSRHRSDRR